jgi:hypothetical protein
MNEIILMAFERADIRVTRSTFKDVDRIDIRNYLDIDGERRPTKKGVSIPLDRVPDLIAALQALSIGGGDA